MYCEYSLYLENPWSRTHNKQECERVDLTSAALSSPVSCTVYSVLYEPRRRKLLVARASEDERKELLPTPALLGARGIASRTLTCFAFVPTNFRGEMFAEEVCIVCTYKGVEMHDGTRHCSRRATHAGTDFHS